MNNFTDTPCDNIMPEYLKKSIINKHEINDPISGVYPSAKEFIDSNTRELLSKLESAKEDFECICKICDDKHPEHCTDNMKSIIRSLLYAKIKEIQKDLDSME